MNSSKLSRRPSNATTAPDGERNGAPSKLALPPSRRNRPTMPRIDDRAGRYVERSGREPIKQRKKRATPQSPIANEAGYGWAASPVELDENPPLTSFGVNSAQPPSQNQSTGIFRAVK